MKGYETTDESWHFLLHMDAYRIDDISELEPLHFAELMKKAGTLFCVEWAGNIAEALPAETIRLRFENTDNEKERIVHIEGLPVNRY